jgi:hypothetical protein
MRMSDLQQRAALKFRFQPDLVTQTERHESVGLRVKEWLPLKVADQR